MTLHTIQDQQFCIVREEKYSILPMVPLKSTFIYFILRSTGYNTSLCICPLKPVFFGAPSISCSLMALRTMEDLQTCIVSKDTDVLRGHVFDTVTIGGQISDTVAIGGHVFNTMAIEGQVFDTVAIRGQVFDTVANEGQVFDNVAIRGQVFDALAFKGQVFDTEANYLTHWRPSL